MTKMVSSCVEDAGLRSHIPDSPVRMTSFVEAYHRLRDDMEQFRTGFLLEPWQFHAAMTFYFANKDLFDAEYKRVKERQCRFWEEAANNQDARLAWAELKGAWTGDETDEEIKQLLEELS